MTLYHRIKRWLGYGTKRRLKKIEPCYQYTVTHLNGETTTFVARNYTMKEGGFAEFYKYKRTGDIFTRRSFFGEEKEKLLIIGDSAFPKRVKVKVLEGIQEIEKSHHHNNKFIVEYDMADGKITNETCIANFDKDE